MASISKKRDETQYCPVCGAELAVEAESPRYDAPCRVCRSLLWCRKTKSGEITILDVIPG